MERADYFRIYASMNREKILEMLKAHSNGMEDLSLSLAIIENGRIQCYYYNGEGLTEEIPRLIYEIGSVTKTFTAALLMKMISEGMLNLSDSIDRYLPRSNGRIRHPLLRFFSSSRIHPESEMILNAPRRSLGSIL